MTKKEQPKFQDALETIGIEKATRYANCKAGYLGKTYKPRNLGLPINNPYGNVSEGKLKTINTFIQKVFNYYNQPYWVHVTLHYPPQLPNNDKVIHSCLRALRSQKDKLASHYIIATEAGIKNNRYHHHVFIYAGSFASVCKVEERLRKLWGEILHSRFKNIFEECELCDAFNSAHVYEIENTQPINVEQLYRKDINFESFQATQLGLSDVNNSSCLEDLYNEKENSEKNYSRLAWSSYPKFDRYDQTKWKEEAFYHLSYICKMAHPDLPEKKLRFHTREACKLRPKRY